MKQSLVPRNWHDYIQMKYKQSMLYIRYVPAFLPSISDQNSKRVKGFTGPSKLETFKRPYKSFQHQKCEKANMAHVWTLTQEEDADKKFQQSVLESPNKQF